MGSTWGPPIHPDVFLAAVAAALPAPQGAHLAHLAADPAVGGANLLEALVSRGDLSASTRKPLLSRWLRAPTPTRRATMTGRPVLPLPDAALTVLEAPPDLQCQLAQVVVESSAVDLKSDGAFFDVVAYVGDRQALEILTRGLVTSSQARDRMLAGSDLLPRSLLLRDPTPALRSVFADLGVLDALLDVSTRAGSGHGAGGAAGFPPGYYRSMVTAYGRHDPAGVCAVLLEDHSGQMASALDLTEAWICAEVVDHYLNLARAEVANATAKGMVCDDAVRACLQALVRLDLDQSRALAADLLTIASLLPDTQVASLRRHAAALDDVANLMELPAAEVITALEAWPHPSMAAVPVLRRTDASARTRVTWAAALYDRGKQVELGGHRFDYSLCTPAELCPGDLAFQAWAELEEPDWVEDVCGEDVRYAVGTAAHVLEHYDQMAPHMFHASVPGALAQAANRFALDVVDAGGILDETWVRSVSMTAVQALLDGPLQVARPVAGMIFPSLATPASLQTLAAVLVGSETLRLGDVLDAVAVATGD